MSERYEILKQFICSDMHMTHMYQPAVLRALLQNGGRGSVKQIAHALMPKYDCEGVEYYIGRAEANPLDKLIKHKMIEKKQNKTYSLIDHSTMSEGEIEELAQLCCIVIKNYIDSNGFKIWEKTGKRDKRVDSNIPEFTRNTALHHAGGRCAECGVDAGENELRICYIAGAEAGNSLNNLQALCPLCYYGKDRLSERGLHEVPIVYAVREYGCNFCTVPHTDITGENDLAIAFRDSYPVTKHHTLIVPKRHVPDYFNLKKTEHDQVHELLQQQHAELRRMDNSITGFNVGINAGKSAGQSVFHCHIHLIPRRDDDTPNPHGGVRGVIPGRQAY